MKKLLYILLLFISVSAFSQAWPVDSFAVIYNQNWEDNTPGYYQNNLSEWMDDWNEPASRAYFNGRETTGVVADADGKSMIIYYPDGTTNGEDQGCDFETYNIIGYDNDSLEMYFSHDIMWRPGFNFVISGKIAGSLNGGKRWIRVGSPTFYEGFKAKFSWYRAQWNNRGTVSLYVYHHDLPGLSGEAKTLYDPDNWGTVYYFDTSEETWVNLTMRVVMNTCNNWEIGEEGNYDGIIEAFINGKLAYTWEGLRLRDVDTIGINDFRMYSQFGGAGPEFTTQRDEWLKVDNLYMWNYDWDVQGVPRRYETHDPGDVLHLPSSWTHTILSEETPDTSPVVYTIPNQAILEGETFTNINLNLYASDPDNANSELTWTYSGNSDISVSINNDSIAQLTYSGWTGTEQITFRATDPDAQYDEYTATFTVSPVSLGYENQSILINFADQDDEIPPTNIDGETWNHFSINNQNNDSIYYLDNINGGNSGITIQLLNDGTTIGNNKFGSPNTAYPDTCELTYWLTATPVVGRLLFSGLTIGNTYIMKTYSSWGSAANTTVTLLDTAKVTAVEDNTEILQWEWVADQTSDTLEWTSGSYGFLNIAELNEYTSEAPILKDTVSAMNKLYLAAVYDTVSECQVQVINDTATIGYLDSGTWLRIDNVDFTGGFVSLSIRFINPLDTATYIGTLDSLDGDTIFNIKLSQTADWYTFAVDDHNLLSTVTGVHDLYIYSLYDYGGNIEWILFRQNVASGSIINYILDAKLDHYIATDKKSEGWIIGN